MRDATVKEYYVVEIKKNYFYIKFDLRIFYYIFSI